jgi:hypothetical protein
VSRREAEVEDPSVVEVLEEEDGAEEKEFP